MSKRKSYSALKKKISDLEQSLHTKNNRIAVLLLANAVLEEKAVVDAPTNFFELKFGDPTKDDIIEGDVAFSSRFMPNVKFRIMGWQMEFIRKIGISLDFNYLRTSTEGVISNGCDYQGKFDDEWPEKEVSIYEAVPELVPDGMVYDKESDSLVEGGKVKVYACSGLKNRIKPNFLALDEVDFSDYDSERFEAMLSKVAHRQKSGVDYDPDSVAFKKVSSEKLSCVSCPYYQGAVQLHDSLSLSHMCAKLGHIYLQVTPKDLCCSLHPKKS